MNNGTIILLNVGSKTEAVLTAQMGTIYRLQRVEHPAEAMQSLVHDNTRMILIGLQGENRSGVEEHRELLEHPHAAGVSVIFLDGPADAVKELSALELGADDYLCVDVAPEIACARLRNHLTGKRLGATREGDALSIQRKRNDKLHLELAMLSGINSAIARLRERTTLFDEAARVSIQSGGFTAAWVGFLNKESSLTPASCRGVDQEDLRGLPLLTFDDNQSPASVLHQCVASGQVTAQNDTSMAGTDDLPGQEAKRLGFGSLAALPLKPWEQVDGVMILYSRQPHAFQADDIAFLADIASDLSFALRNLEQQDRANYLYYYDVLTGLPNFSLFLDRLTQVIYAAYSQGAGVQVAVANLGHFKQVNEVWGRQVGNQVLETVAQRLRAGLPEQANIARVAGDSFAIADLYLDNADLTLTLDRIVGLIEEPIEIEGQTLQLSARIGCATSPSDGEESEIVFRNAEAALKEAKLTGEQVKFYTPNLNANAAHHLELESMLRAALGGDQFVLHYQPKVDSTTGRIVAAEALIRWQHPIKGMVSPSEFIPLAEETRLIIPIGRWVIEQVCAQQAAWRKQGLGIVPIALNLSALQFKGSDVLSDVKEALARHGLSPEFVELELTETLVMQDPISAEATMRSLRDAGLHLSLDDFGTGYSSLAYLKRFPFSSVKIDRAFVSDITSNSGDAAIARAIIGMGHSLQLKVIAEGVETEGQLDVLREAGCDQIQGYFFSRPVSDQVFGQMLSAGRALGRT